jgi:hypothetical protein
MAALHAAGSFQGFSRRSADESAVAVQRDEIDEAGALRAPGKFHRESSEVGAQRGQHLAEAGAAQASAGLRGIGSLDRDAPDDVALERGDAGAGVLSDFRG